MSSAGGFGKIKNASFPNTTNKTVGLNWATTFNTEFLIATSALCALRLNKQSHCFDDGTCGSVRFTINVASTLPQR